MMCTFRLLMVRRAFACAAIEGQLA